MNPPTCGCRRALVSVHTLSVVVEQKEKYTGVSARKLYRVCVCVFVCLCTSRQLIASCSGNLKVTKGQQYAAH